MPILDEELEHADWVEDGLDDTGSPWRDYFGRQAQRAVVVVLIVVLLCLFRQTGRPGHWVLTQVHHAMEVDFSPMIARAASAPRFQNLAAKARAWLAREWQVTGESLTRTNAGDEPTLIWPVVGDYRLSRPQQGGFGLDLQIAAGSPVLAAAAGTVQELRNESGGYGLVIVHHDGWRTVYGRCQGLLVGRGEQVSTGQTIALVGSAPPPTPSHLHFEVWSPEGEMDPLPYLGDKDNHVRI